MLNFGSVCVSVFFSRNDVLLDPLNLIPKKATKNCTSGKIGSNSASAEAGWKNQVLSGTFQTETFS